MERYAIFLDLDGTLLTSNKELSERNAEALTRAWEKGAYIIPATGRIYPGMPQVIRELPFVRYTVAVNGAQIYDSVEKRAVCSEEIPVQRALEIFSIFDTYSGIYDCYAGDQGYMERTMYESADKYIADEPILKLVRELRRPVDGFKDYIVQNFTSVQKAQMFFADMEEREHAMEYLKTALPDCSVSSSVKGNIEVNSSKANKGEAVLLMCRYLGIPRENSIAFGDNINDIAMLESAGVGVAMGNALPEVKEKADMVTGTNDEDGVAEALIKLLKL